MIINRNNSPSYLSLRRRIGFHRQLESKFIWPLLLQMLGDLNSQKIVLLADWFTIFKLNKIPNLEFVFKGSWTSSSSLCAFILDEVQITIHRFIFDGVDNTALERSHGEVTWPIWKWRVLSRNENLETQITRTFYSSSLT